MKREICFVLMFIFMLVALPLYAYEPNQCTRCIVEKPKVKEQCSDLGWNIDDRSKWNDMIADWCEHYPDACERFKVECWDACNPVPAPCTKCILQNRPDVLQNFQNWGWENIEANWNGIVLHWCGIDAIGCGLDKLKCKEVCIEGSVPTSCSLCVFTKNLQALREYYNDRLGFDVAYDSNYYEAVLNHWCTFVNPEGCNTSWTECQASGCSKLAVDSPILGSFVITKDTSYDPIRWSVWQHMCGCNPDENCYHGPNCGIEHADDTWAWDYQLDPSDRDAGLPFYPVAKGKVVQWFSNTMYAKYKPILIEHVDNYGKKWFSGYLHAKDVFVKVDDEVDLETMLGTIGDSGSTNINHLHLAVYKGKDGYDKLESVDAVFRPSLLRIVPSLSSIEISLTEIKQLKAFGIAERNGHGITFDLNDPEKTINFKWLSLNPEIASVDEIGNVIGKKIGQTEIEIYFSGEKAVVPVTVHGPYPDLIPVKPIKMDPKPCYAGLPVKFQSGVHNAGKADAGMFYARWFVDDKEVAYGKYPGCKAGATIIGEPGMLFWTPPAPGTYTIMFEVDSGNQVKEDWEDNNATIKKIHVQEPFPDLRPIYPIKCTPTKVVVGKQIKFQSGVENIGKANAGMFYAKWSINGKEVSYGKYPKGCPKGESIIGEPGILYWTPTVPGDYTIKFEVDSGNQIKEEKENNNSITKGITVLFIDLAPKDIQVKKPSKGKEWLFTSEIMNKGNMASPAFNVKWFVDGKLKNKNRITGLGPAPAHVKNQFRWTPPPNKPKAYTVEIIVNDEGEVNEDGSNNRKRKVIFVR